MTELGSLSFDGEYATITFRRRLVHPVDVVWAAITDPAERVHWFGETTIDDGVIEMDPSDPPAAPDAKRMTGKILVWEPPHVFEHEWNQRIIGASVVRYELTEDGDGTLLTFTHRGLSERNAKGFIPGTHAFFDRMAAHLDGAPLPAWQERYAEVAPHYPAWS
ncbi:SRPBCC family protein [Amycolatopsis acidicola]|uniref:SRPBCC family protein n=1 Tax=Amycolatopsis acidicola TaxID=2596893 RepID=A0A5N0V6R2_9PSEU|nr:SRPBCC family protein [Amycolatopsis acidicola]KAA9161138.1 SRPBCC family protein [Amycolatopsis acidicola]